MFRENLIHMEGLLERLRRSGFKIIERGREHTIIIISVLSMMAKTIHQLGSEGTHGEK